MNSTQHPAVAGEILKLVKLNNDSFQYEENANAEQMAQLLTSDFTILRPGDFEQGKQGKVVRNTEFLQGMAARGRLVEDVCVRLFGEVAVITSLLSTHGKQAGLFWNTKICVKQADGEWRIRDWRVNRIS